MPIATPLAPAGPAAARAGSSRSSFLRMASHELRTPLNSIIGFSELIACELYGPVGAPQYIEYAGIIHDSGKRLLRMVNQVLEVVRLQEQAAELDAAPQSLDEAIQDAQAALTAAGVSYRSEVYAGKLHGWMKPDMPVYDAEAAERGWAELVALYRRTIG